MTELTLRAIQARHPGCHIQTFDAGTIDGQAWDDVLVWETEADSVNDDGARAIARYLIPAKE